MPPNPLNKADAEHRVLIIFDGLDELAMQGDFAQGFANNFLVEVVRKSRHFNKERCRVNFLITSRNIIHGKKFHSFLKEGQILNILPYFLGREKFQKAQQILQKSEDINWIDEEYLLAIDQRQEWWLRYGQLTGRGFQSLPDDLVQSDLSEITTQPLLNYLIALSYTSGNINFSTINSTNQIYEDLIHQVYKRVWENYQHPTLGHISEEEFFLLLEEISVVCWHTNGRTANLNVVEKYLNNSSLSIFLTALLEEKDNNISKLLTAFYFQEVKTQNFNPTFEFTHKSFSEYLISRRIIHELSLIHENFEAYKEANNSGWSEQECLRKWIIICGPKALDKYIFGYILHEVSLQDGVKIEQWKNTLQSLVGYMLKYGMPMDLLHPRPKYWSEFQQSLNSEEALFATLNACARATGSEIEINWPSYNDFKKVFSRLKNQRSDTTYPIIENCLGYLGVIHE